MVRKLIILRFLKYDVIYSWPVTLAGGRTNFLDEWQVQSQRDFFIWVRILTFFLHLVRDSNSPARGKLIMVLLYFEYTATFIFCVCCWFKLFEYSKSLVHCYFYFFCLLLI